MFPPDVAAALEGPGHNARCVAVPKGMGRLGAGDGNFQSGADLAHALVAESAQAFCEMCLRRPCD